MRYVNSTIIVLALACLAGPTTSLHGQAQQQESLVWAPVPSTPNKWIAPNKAHTKLTELLASHKGQASWREPIVRDVLLTADYVQMAPGTKTPRQFQPDNPIWWIVQSGEVRSRSKDRSRWSPPKASWSRFHIATSISSRRSARRQRSSSKSRSPIHRRCTRLMRRQCRFPARSS